MIEAISAYPTAPMALILIIPLSFLLFSSLPPYRAAFTCLLVSVLLLPVGYGWTVPGLTILDKATIPLLASFAACAATAPGEFRNMRLHRGTLFFVSAIAIGSFMTAVTNLEPYFVGGIVLPPLALWDGVAILRVAGFQFILPFLLGRMLVRDVAQLEGLLRAFVVGMLIYSIPMLWEVRMSPQLHSAVYGYFPLSFAQQMRDGGFRPVVFVGHGLPLAIITSFAVIASEILWRRGRRLWGLPSALLTTYLIAVVAVCKTLSAMVYAGAGSAVVLLGSPRMQVRAATLIAAISLAYPILRGFDLFPTSTLEQLSGAASEERSDSLAFRFNHEDALLEHARERWLFGWGGWGRNRVIDEEGRDISVTDGLWIILLGQGGAVAFLSTFGLVLLPVFRCSRALVNLTSESDRRLLASLALLVALNWADSLPNALSGGVVMVFLTGAFSGVVDVYQRPRARRPETPERGRATPRFDPATAG